MDPAGHAAYLRQRSRNPLRGLALAVPGDLEELLADLGEYLAPLRGAPDLAELAASAPATAAACSGHQSPPLALPARSSS